MARDALAVAALNAAVAYLPNALTKTVVTEVADHFYDWLDQKTGGHDG